MGDNKISEASLPVVARYVGKTSNIYRYIAEDLAVVDAQIADEAHLQGEAVPVGYRWRHSAGEKWQYSDVPCGWEHEPLFTHPQPAELNEVSGNSGELPPEEVTLKQVIDGYVATYGSLRQAAELLCIDPAYLSRLAGGSKTNPSDEVLEKLGLERRVVYTSKVQDYQPTKLHQRTKYA